MNVRIVPQGQPQRTDLYSSVIGPITCDGFMYQMTLSNGARPVLLLKKSVAEILLDEDGAVS